MGEIDWRAMYSFANSNLHWYKNQSNRSNTSVQVLSLLNRSPQVRFVKLVEKLFLIPSRSQEC